MTFLIVFLIVLAVSLEAVGTYISVIGLASSFGKTSLLLLVAIILDVVKLTMVGTYFKMRHVFSMTAKLYMIPAVIVMMLITSWGIMGYLQQSFNSSLIPLQKAEISLMNDKHLLETHEARLNEINTHLNSIGKNYISKRMEERKSLTPEIESLQTEIGELRTSIAENEIKVIELQNHTGPITAISKNFDVSTATAANVIIGMIMFVFDPLTIALMGMAMAISRYYEDKNGSPKTEQPKPIIIGSNKPIVDDTIEVPKEKYPPEIDDPFYDVKPSILHEEDRDMSSIIDQYKK